MITQAWFVPYLAHLPLIGAGARAFSEGAYVHKVKERPVLEALLAYCWANGNVVSLVAVGGTSPTPTPAGATVGFPL